MRITEFTNGLYLHEKLGYVFPGDIIIDEDLVVDLPTWMTIQGKVQVAGNVVADNGLSATKSIRVTGDIESASGSVRSGRDICVGGSIRAAHRIVADQGITAGTSITSTLSQITTAHGDIKARRSIFSGKNIQAERHIIATRGMIRADSNIQAVHGDVVSCLDMEATHGEIRANNEIKARHGNIKAGRCIISGQDIEAGGRIDCAKGIECGGNIRAESITTGWGLKANETIQAKTFIQVERRIFAGLYLYFTSQNANNTIQCAELRKGEICYGELHITPVEE